jgi:hypothetical protein
MGFEGVVGEGFEDLVGGEGVGGKPVVGLGVANFGGEFFGSFGRAGSGIHEVEESGGESVVEGDDVDGEEDAGVSGGEGDVLGGEALEGEHGVVGLFLGVGIGGFLPGGPECGETFAVAQGQGEGELEVLAFADQGSFVVGSGFDEEIEGFFFHNLLGLDGMLGGVFVEGFDFLGDEFVPGVGAAAVLAAIDFLLDGLLEGFELIFLGLGEEGVDGFAGDGKGVVIAEAVVLDKEGAGADVDGGEGRGGLDGLEIAGAGLGEGDFGGFVVGEADIPGGVAHEVAGHEGGKEVVFVLGDGGKVLEVGVGAGDVFENHDEAELIGGGVVEDAVGFTGLEASGEEEGGGEEEDAEGGFGSW